VPTFDRLRTEPVYNTRAVVQRTGVPADTFRAWERRYGLPVPSRTSGNQRLYSERDIAVIAWLRDQTRAGLTISQAVYLFRSESDGGVETGTPVEDSFQALDNPGPVPNATPMPVLDTRTLRLLPFDQDGPSRDSQYEHVRLFHYRDRLVEALTRFDAATADQIVEEAVALLPVEQVCSQILHLTLVEMGDRWARGELSISSEHFASAFVLRKVGSLYNLSQPQVGRGPIVAACVEGELHEIGLLLTCLYLSRAGFNTVYLGPNLPAADLGHAVERLRPPLVLLSATSDRAFDRLTFAVRALRELNRRDGGGMGLPLIGYGGGLFAQRADLRARVDAEYVGRTPNEVIANVDRLLASIGV